MSPSPKNSQSIKKELEQSPRGISPTKKRIEYLTKVKELRQLRNEERRNFSTTKNSLITPLKEMMIEDQNSQSRASFGHRKMTLD